jgi:hypothetical protein
MSTENTVHANITIHGSTLVDNGSRAIFLLVFDPDLFCKREMIYVNPETDITEDSRNPHPPKTIKTVRIATQMHI